MATITNDLDNLYADSIENDGFDDIDSDLIEPSINEFEQEGLEDPDFDDIVPTFIDQVEDDDIDADPIDDEPVLKQTETSDVILDILKSKGIDNPEEIQYEDDNGEIVTQNFYELPYEEQLAILDSADPSQSFTEYESDVISWLRENEVTFEDAIAYFRKQAVDEYIQEQNTTNLTIDNYTNDELFLLDLKSKYDFLTDEQLTSQLEKEKSDEEIFNKKMEKIREEYKEIEVKEKEALVEAKKKEESEAFEELKNNLIESARATQDIGGITLEDSDRNEILNFTLVKDVNNKTALDKVLEDPQMKFELAWYATKGKDAFDFIHNYYKKEIEKANKSAYEKGKEDALRGPGKKAKTGIIVDKKKPVTRTNNSQNLTIDDLY